jgi:hypothetical protein
MFTIEDFVSKYKSYTDEELINIHSNISGYSQEAQEALAIVIQNKGGMDELVRRMKEKQIVADEINRIRKETAEFGSQGVDASFIKNVTSSTILSSEQVNEIIENKYAAVELELEDKKIKPRTIFGSVIGTVIASLIGGTLWGLQMIYSKRIFYILFLGLILLCYGILKLSTKQTKKNTIVLVATAISIILSVLLGQLLYAIIGYKE